MTQSTNLTEQVWQILGELEARGLYYSRKALTVDYRLMAEVSEPFDVIEGFGTTKIDHITNTTKFKPNSPSSMILEYVIGDVVTEVSTRKGHYSEYDFHIIIRPYDKEIGYFSVAPSAPRQTENFMKRAKSIMNEVADKFGYEVVDAN